MSGLFGDIPVLVQHIPWLSCRLVSPGTETSPMELFCSLFTPWDTLC